MVAAGVAVVTATVTAGVTATVTGGGVTDAAKVGNIGNVVACRPNNVFSIKKNIF